MFKILNLASEAKFDLWGQSSLKSKVAYLTEEPYSKILFEYLL